LFCQTVLHFLRREERETPIDRVLFKRSEQTIRIA
jgi:hypothetical protein